MMVEPGEEPSAHAGRKGRCCWLARNDLESSGKTTVKHEADYSLN